MTGRLGSGVLVGALLRRTHAAGGHATVLARGDEHGGAILVLTLDRGRDARLWERSTGGDGKARMLPAGPQDAVSESELTDYWQRRRERDRDLWVIELDIPSAERFAAETICDG